MPEAPEITENTTAENTAASEEAPNIENISSARGWLDNLSPELKSAKTLQKFKDVSALANSYLEAEKSIRRSIMLPKPDAPEEAWEKIYNKLGRPEDKHYIEQRVPEDEQFIKAYEEMFYQSGLSKKQGEKLLDGMYRYNNDLQQKQQQELEEIRNANVNALVGYYGEQFNGNIELARAALSKFGTKEAADLVEQSGYAPALVDLLVQVGQTLKSDSLITGNEVPSVTTPKNALSEIKKLEADPEFMIKYRDSNKPGHKEAVTRLETLYDTAYNNDTR